MVFGQTLSSLKIGDGSPIAPSALLEIKGTTGTFLLPRMTTTQKNAITAVNGEMVYDTTLGGFSVYQGGSWSTLTTGAIAWGAITGTLSAQTDLQSALDAKLTNPMTTLGDTIYENATPAGARLAGNTTTTKKFLAQTGNGTISAAPTWGTLAGSDLPNPTASTLGGIESYAAVTNQWINAISTIGVPSSTQPGFTNLSGTLSIAQAGALPTSVITNGTFAQAQLGIYLGAIAGSQISSGTVNTSVLGSVPFTSLSGTISVAQAGTYTGSLAASQVTSGTFAQAQLGVYLGAIAGSQISSGTINTSVLGSIPFTSLNGTISIAQHGTIPFTSLSGTVSVAQAGTYTGALAASQVTSGTFNQAQLGVYLGAIAGSQISSGTVNTSVLGSVPFTSLSGTISIAQHGTIPLSNMSGTVSVAQAGTYLGNIAASQVTSGTFNLAQIGTVPFANLGGTISIAQAGSLPTSVITNGTFNQAQLGTYLGTVASGQLSGTISMAVNGVTTIANGGTGNITAQAAIDALLPAQTGNATKALITNGTTSSWGVAGSGSVTAVGMTVPSFLSISGSPVTSAGTLAVTLSGTALPVANGGSGQTSFATNAVLLGGASIGTVATAGSVGQFLSLTTGGTPSWANASGNITADVFSGDGSTTAFTLSVSPANKNNTQVYVGGVYQQKANYTLSAATLTFNTAPPTGSSNIEVDSGTYLAQATPGVPIIETKSAAFATDGTTNIVFMNAVGLTGTLASAANSAIVTYMNTSTSGTLGRSGSDVFQPGGSTSIVLPNKYDSVTVQSDASSNQYITTYRRMPVVTNYTATGASTHTFQSGTLYFTFEGIGGGGGGGSTGSSGTGTGGTGGSTTLAYNSVTYTAGGGTGGALNAGGAAGSCTNMDRFATSQGMNGGETGSATGTGGGNGGSGFYGGAGAGGNSNTAPQAAATSTGGGGGGGSGAVAFNSGAGGGSGCWGMKTLHMVNTALTATVTVGTLGQGATAGSGGQQGSNAAAGQATITEYFQ